VTCDSHPCNCYGHEVKCCSSCGTEMMVDNDGFCDECENELPISLDRSEGRGKTLVDDRTRSFKIESKKCALCCYKLDCKYGAEMIHCTECQNDFCFKCQSEPNHQSHRKFFSVKTVLGDHTKCCKTCGWPKGLGTQDYMPEYSMPTSRAKYNPFGGRRRKSSQNTRNPTKYYDHNNPQYHNPSTSYTCHNCECTLNE